MPVRRFGLVLLAMLALAPGALVARGLAQDDAIPVVEVVGKEQLVLDWTQNRCQWEDYPDVPARAFRDADGMVQLFASHDVVRRSSGPDLEHLTHSCKAVMESDHNPDPARFDDAEWISALYTTDGTTVYAIVHNEYQGSTHPGMCPSRSYEKCWYNALTLAVSSDGGATFNEVAAPPDHLIATVPYRYQSGSGPFGIFEPSNVIRGKDGYYYMLARAMTPGSDDSWTCAMRTDDLADPKSWRAWDGSGFDMTFINPYDRSIEAPQQHLCAAISRDEIGEMHDGISYNTYLDRYVLVSTVGRHSNGAWIPGIYTSFSEDMVHWTPAQLLFTSAIFSPDDPNVPTSVAYASLIDPDDTSRNFETTGQNAYVYFTRFNLRRGLYTANRDLVRVPITFYSSAAHQSADSSLHLDLTAKAGTSGVDVSGQLTGPDGSPVANTAIALEATTADASDAVYTFTQIGTVPEGAQRALVGYRVNRECDCAFRTELYLYDIRYTEADESANRVPDPRFLNGLETWHSSGEIAPDVEDSDRGPGEMLHVKVGAGQSSGVNSGSFDVTAGQPYSVTFTARVIPLGLKAGGYFVLIFADADGEIERERLPLEANAYPLGSVRTDRDGNFRLTVFPQTGTDTIVARVRDHFGYLPTVATARVTP